MSLCWDCGGASQDCRCESEQRQDRDTLAAELAALRRVVAMLIRAEALRLCVCPETYAETVALFRRQRGDEPGAAAVEAALKEGT